MALPVRFDPAAPYEVEETDVPFAQSEGKELLARIYRPKGDASSPLAALVDVHGGAWSRSPTKPRWPRPA
jgi:acetyl esterase/lipase